MKFQVAAGILATALFTGDNVHAFSFVPGRSSIIAVTPSNKGINNNKNGRNTRSSSLVMKDDNNAKFSFANLFTGEGAASAAATRALRSSATLEPHPSQRDHINPLNALYPPNKKSIEESAASSSTPPLPFHPAVQSGVLSNGFSYVFLPNRSPPNRFEAHLQVFSGSSDELEPQQGIAHLTEHVAYMGSRKRERLFGTGSQTNAYTDFHHTVFYAACPTVSPNTGTFGGGPQPMLPMALDALCDVMEARCDPSRIEKERQAVLSEMTMVNTIEYRVECQILSTLHRENRLAKRFPIGKESLIQKWNRDDVKTWHRTHYRPDNVLLYVVGDLDPEYVQQTIEDKFGHLTAEKQGSEIALEELKPQASDLADAVVGGTLKQRQSWHYPPVRHDFCVVEGVKDLLDDQTEFLETGDLEVVEKKNGGDDAGSNYDIHLQKPYSLDDKVEFLKEAELSPGKVIRPHIFKHELLQNFSFHLFAKRPVEPIKDMASFRRSLARRVCLAALQIRLNVGGRSDDPAFTFVEFNQLDSAREGCAVCSLDMTADPPRWREAVLKSVAEIRKLGIHGVTPGEMERYASALLTDAEQLAAQGDMISHGDQLSYLMETVANGHTFMSAEQSYVITEQALSTLTLEEVNRSAAELCSHITGLNDGELTSAGKVVAVACAPKGPESGDDSFVDEDKLCQAIRDACSIEVEPVEDVVVPHTLVTPDELEEAMKANPPSWEEGQFSDGTPNTPADRITRPFTLRRLSNGIRVGINQNPAESQRGHLRLVAPGGRDAERRLGFKSGSLAVGARAMQEGGSFGSFSREQVELFAVDHLIMVEITCTEESLVMDFVFPTTNVGNSGYGENMKLGITGTESVLQIVREILIDFNWEEDALGRSKSSYRTAHESLGKSLEGKSTEMIMDAVTSGDDRFLSIDVDTVNAVTLEDAKNAVMSQLRPKDIEISVSGDIVVGEVMEQIRQYLGTVPADTNAEYEVKDAIMEFDSVPKLAPGKHLDLELEDSDPRAVAYVAGASPNQWGFLADGTSVAQRVSEADKRASDYDKQRRAHPLFGNAALSLISEIANRRLFSTVRERKQLTYDANFSLTGFERMKGGSFLVTVTASKEKAQKALDACKETLEALRKSNPISVDNLESAKRVVLNRHEGELRTSQYWATIMSGIQEESIPLKGPLSVTDFHVVIEAMTTTDLQLALDCMGLDESELYTCIGKTVQPVGLVVDDIVKASPMAGMGRGGALMG